MLAMVMSAGVLRKFGERVLRSAKWQGPPAIIRITMMIIARASDGKIDLQKRLTRSCSFGVGTTTGTKNGEPPPSANNFLDHLRQ